MNERERSIYDFLKNSRFLIHSDNGQQHYTVKQINMFSDLKVTATELIKMEKAGYLAHVYFKSHGNCYYAI